MWYTSGNYKIENKSFLIIGIGINTKKNHQKKNFNLFHYGMFRFKNQ